MSCCGVYCRSSVTGSSLGTSANCRVNIWVNYIKIMVEEKLTSSSSPSSSSSLMLSSMSRRQDLLWTIIRSWTLEEKLMVAVTRWQSRPDIKEHLVLLSRDALVISCEEQRTKLIGLSFAFLSSPFTLSACLQNSFFFFLILFFPLPTAQFLLLLVSFYELQSSLSLWTLPSLALSISASLSLSLFPCYPVSPFSIQIFYPSHSSLASVSLLFFFLNFSF